MVELNDNFWKWFGNSKVVNPDGTPMIVYHGTNKEFSAFNRLFAYNGFYFVTDKRKAEVAGYYAYSNDRNGKIMPCYLSVQNPYICTPQTKADVDFSKCDGIIVLSDFDFQSNYYDYEQKELKISDMKKGDIVEIIVWNPNQIKSVNNKGNWSTNSDNIYESRKNRLVQTAEELDKLCESSNKIIAYHGGRFGNKYFWFSSSPKVAGSYGKITWSVMGVPQYNDYQTYELFLEKPTLIVDAKDNNYLDIPTPKILKDEWSSKTIDTDGVIDIAYKRGYKSVIIKNVWEGSAPEKATDYIVFSKDNFREIEKTNENFYTKSRGNKMNEEATTFFKDKKNKNGSRVKNPNRVYAAKKAHKTHGFSYKRAAEKMTCSEIADFLDREVSEANITADNKVNMYSEISFNDLTGAFQVQVKENLTDFDIILVAKDSGKGSYKLEGESSDKMQTSLIYNTLVNDLKTLADNIDRDFEAILKKNGLVKRVD